jgi:hypothetical protein
LSRGTGFALHSVLSVQDIHWLARLLLFTFEQTRLLEGAIGSLGIFRGRPW